MIRYLVIASERAEYAGSVPLDKRLIVPSVDMHIIELHTL